MGFLRCDDADNKKFKKAFWSWSKWKKAPLKIDGKGPQFEYYLLKITI